MAVRQYIGARYVTKIYENSLDPSTAEWEVNVNYEPLTLVTYNNGSYLSKKDVPANIGNPASNPIYWVQTGFYNGQIATLENRIAAVEPYAKETYAPVTEGDFIFTSADGDTEVHYVLIDKAYKPRLVLAGDNVKEGGSFVTADVGLVAKREKATICMNASTIHSSGTTSGTIIVDGDVKFINDIDYDEWSAYALENLYMTEDGSLNVIDAFASIATIESLNPVWTFQGWQKIAEDGVLNDTIRKNVYAPRSIIAQDYDGNYLLMTTGGRRFDNIGMTYSDVMTAIASLNFNARIIYDCDGGGSSSLVVHQIRQNDIIESAPRKVPTMLVFDVPDVSYSDYEAGYSAYLSDVQARTEKTNVNSRVFRVVGDLTPGYDSLGYELHQGISDAYDKFTYKRLLRLGYQTTEHKIVIDALRSNDQFLNALTIKDSTDEAVMLGKEVWRASSFTKYDDTFTSSAAGKIDSNVLVTGGISITDNYIIQAIDLNQGHYITVSQYSGRYIFNIFNDSDDTRAANATIHLRVLIANNPKGH